MVQALSRIQSSCTVNKCPFLHHHNGTSESCIDYSVSNFPLDDLRELCTLDCPTNLSSHDPICTSLAVPTTDNSKVSEYSKTYSDLNRKRVFWGKSKIQLNRDLTDRAFLEATEYWDVPEATPLLCSLQPHLLKCAEMTMETKSAKKDVFFCPSEE